MARKERIVIALGGNALGNTLPEQKNLPGCFLFSGYLRLLIFAIIV